MGEHLSANVWNTRWVELSWCTHKNADQIFTITRFSTAYLGRSKIGIIILHILLSLRIKMKFYGPQLYFNMKSFVYRCQIWYPTIRLIYSLKTDEAAQNNITLTKKSKRLLVKWIPCLFVNQIDTRVKLKVLRTGHL